jgi:hypothetical protein
LSSPPLPIFSENKESQNQGWVQALLVEMCMVEWVYSHLVFETYNFVKDTIVQICIRELMYQELHEFHTCFSPAVSISGDMHLGYYLKNYFQRIVNIQIIRGRNASEEWINMRL